MSTNLTRVERIIKEHLVEKQTSVSPGDLVNVQVDHVYVQDGNSPTIAKLFEEYGFSSVWNSEKINFVFDHSVLVANADMADRMKEGEKFGQTMGIDVIKNGTGISHILAAERGWFRPGNIVIGSDSHTCVGGAYDALGLGMGASDIVAAMVTGRVWLKVPKTVRVLFTGFPPERTRARDVIINLLRVYGQEPFLYCSVEFVGEWINSLTNDERASFASLGVELGAKCVFFDCESSNTIIDIEFDITTVSPQVSYPHLPANSVDISKALGIQIDYAFVGSCTNGRLDDLTEVAQILSGKTISPNVQLVITPGSAEIYREASSNGILEILSKAGAIITPPGCGACVGTQGPIPASNDVVISTMNRNFKGRMGNPKAEIYLASPRVVAQSALTGSITDIEEVF